MGERTGWAGPHTPLCSDNEAWSCTPAPMATPTVTAAVQVTWSCGGPGSGVPRHYRGRKTHALSMGTLLTRVPGRLNRAWGKYGECFPTGKIMSLD